MSFHIEFLSYDNQIFWLPSKISDSKLLPDGRQSLILSSEQLLYHNDLIFTLICHQFLLQFSTWQVFICTLFYVDSQKSGDLLCVALEDVD